MTEEIAPNQEPQPEPTAAAQDATPAAEAAATPEPAAEPAGAKPRAPRKAKAKAEGKTEDASAADAAEQAEGEGKPKAERKAKAEGKTKGEGKPKGEAKAKAEGKGKGKAEVKLKAPPAQRVPPRLKVRYKEEILPALIRELGLSNPMEAPRLRQVVINMGVGVATQEPKAMEGAVKELGQITGQRPSITRARKSIAAFKVREGNPVGCRVTLRGDRMYEFLDRLFNAALPRIRDFRGLAPRSFDGRGNYTMGLREQLIFPELNIDQIERVRGMDIVITTTARTDEAGRALLSKLGLPLRES